MGYNYLIRASLCVAMDGNELFYKHIHSLSFFMNNIFLLGSFPRTISTVHVYNCLIILSFKHSKSIVLFNLFRMKRNTIVFDLNKLQWQLVNEINENIFTKYFKVCYKIREQNLNKIRHSRDKGHFLVHSFFFIRTKFIRMSSLIFWWNLTKPISSNKILGTKSTKPNLPNHLYQTKSMAHKLSNKHSPIASCSWGLA